MTLLRTTHEPPSTGAFIIGPGFHRVPLSDPIRFLERAYYKGYYKGTIKGPK